MEKCLTIVGRAKSAKKFSEIFIEILVDSVGEEDFEIESVEYLGDYAELDGLSRFIAFVLVNDNSKKEMKIERLFSNLISMQMGVRLFENLGDAKSYAEENYMYSELAENDTQEDSSEDENEVGEDDFPRFTAEEVEDFMLFESLFRTGKLAVIRGKVFDNTTVVMAHIIDGPDQVRVTPYALMINAEILENLDLPRIDERG